MSVLVIKHPRMEELDSHLVLAGACVVCLNVSAIAVEGGFLFRKVCVLDRNRRLQGQLFIFTLSVVSFLKMSSWDCKSLGFAGGKQTSLVRGGKVSLLHYSYLITKVVLCSVFMN